MCHTMYSVGKENNPCPSLCSWLRDVCAKFAKHTKLYHSRMSCLIRVDSLQLPTIFLVFPTVLVCWSTYALSARNEELADLNYHWTASSYISFEHLGSISSIGTR